MSSPYRTHLMDNVDLRARAFVQRLISAVVVTSTICLLYIPSRADTVYNGDLVQIWFAAKELATIGCPRSFCGSSAPCYGGFTDTNQLAAVSTNFGGDCGIFCGCCKEGGATAAGIIRVRIFVDPVTGMPKPPSQGGVPVVPPPGSRLILGTTSGSTCAYGCRGSYASPSYSAVGVAVVGAKYAVELNRDPICGFGECINEAILDGDALEFLLLAHAAGSFCSGAGAQVDLNGTYVIAPDGAAAHSPSPTAAFRGATVAQGSNLVIKLENQTACPWTEVRVRLYNASDAPSDSVTLPSLAAFSAVEWVVPGSLANGSVRVDGRAGIKLLAPLSQPTLFAYYRPTIAPFVLLPSLGDGDVNRGIFALDGTAVQPGCAVGALAVSDTVAAPGDPIVVPIAQGNCSCEGTASARPVVPGFEVTVYAAIPRPSGLSFDPTGVLYVGNGDNAATGAQIHRVGVGGTPVSAFGNSMYDPDAVQFDVSGSISGVPGSVLVAVQYQEYQTPGAVKVIRPDETVFTRFGPTSVFNNPGDMAFDGMGRLLFTDIDPDRRNILTTSGGFPTVLANLPANARPLGIAIDATNRIFTAALDGVIRIHDSNGALVNGSFATGMGSALAFGSDVCFGTDLYAADNDSHLVRIDSAGTATVIGDGFGDVSDLAFGPDGALYVSEYSNDRVLRITRASTPLGANGRIAFASDRDGDFEIYSMNADGTNVTPLTDNAAHDRLPAWSPSGTRIAFSSDQDGDEEIYVMTVNGSLRTQLTFNTVSDFSPAWSPDGAKIAFNGDGDPDGDYEIHVMNADGSGRTQLTFNALPDFVPSWSPDCTRIAFVRGTGTGAEIWCMNADGTGQIQLTFNGNQDTEPHWSPDGSRLLFRRELSFGSGWAELFTMNSDGTAQTNITNTATVYEGEGNYSPDGTRIVLNSNEHDPSFDIYVMNTNGTGRTRITNGAGQDSDLDWQTAPDPACDESDLGSFVLQWTLPAEPLGIAVDPSGNVWVGCLDDSVRKYSETGTLLLAFGGSGTGDGQFLQPTDMAFTPQGNVYVGDYGHAQIQEFTNGGGFVRRWNSGGVRAAGVALDANGNVYVTDLQSTVRKFDGNGALISSWPVSPKATGIRVAGGMVVVTEYDSPVVQKFTLDGQPLGTFVSDAIETQGIDLQAGRLYLCDYGGHVVREYKTSGEATRTLGCFGSAEGQFSGPHDVVVVPYSWLYVADRGNSRIQKFALDATSIPDHSTPTSAMLELSQNQPNPFSDGTRFTFRLPAAGEYGLTVYNVAGQAVRRFEGHAATSPVSVEWNGRNTAGTPVAGGVYFYRLEVGADVVTKRMTLLR